ncbi:MAG: hypothetical protein AB1Z98_07105 [Nannocystaceae bacterium]
MLLAELSGVPSVEAALALPLGERDGQLIDLRMELYGAQAPAYLECPQCDEGMEDQIDLRRIRLAPPDVGPSPHAWAAGPFAGRLRLPTTEDLLAAAEVPDAATARSVLLRRLLTELTRYGDRIEPDRLQPDPLPAEVVTAVERELERLDPQAYIVFSQRCPACAHRFEAPFDIGTYLWHELDVDARRLLQEVDALARVYGWTESEILGLSPARRQTYLEMVGAR